LVKTIIHEVLIYRALWLGPVLPGAKCLPSCRSVRSTDISRQFGTGAEVSYGHFGTSAEMSRVQSVLGLKCLNSTISATWKHTGPLHSHIGLHRMGQHGSTDCFSCKSIKPLSSSANVHVINNLETQSASCRLVLSCAIIMARCTNCCCCQSKYRTVRPTCEFSCCLC